MRRLLLAMVLFATTASADEYKLGEIVDGVVCTSDQSVTYAYYLPTAYTTAKRWPVLYVFDPRQRGAFAAGLFREAAEQFGWILISSNNTRSDADMAPNIRALEATIPDAQKRFAIDERRLYTAGFSGTAVLAWALGLSDNRMVGMIGSGGRPVPPDVPEYRVSFDWYGTAGTRDFNYIETYDIDRGLEAAKRGHRVEFFEGGHRWAPPELLKRGVEWLEVQAMKRGLRERDDAIVKRLFDADLAAARADSDPISSLRRHETIIRTFGGLLNVDESIARAKEIRSSREHARAMDEERRAEKLERAGVRKMYAAVTAFLQRDDAQPAPGLAHELQIERLKKLAAGSGYEAAAAQRVLEATYTQLDFYVARELSGQKLTVVKQVAQLIHPKTR